MYPTERKRYIILGAAIGAVFLFFVVVMMLTQLRDGEDYARQAAALPSAPFFCFLWW